MNLLNDSPFEQRFPGWAEGCRCKDKQDPITLEVFGESEEDGGSDPSAWVTERRGAEGCSCFQKSSLCNDAVRRRGIHPITNGPFPDGLLDSVCIEGLRNVYGDRSPIEVAWTCLERCSPLVLVAGDEVVLADGVEFDSVGAKDARPAREDTTHQSHSLSHSGE